MAEIKQPHPVAPVWRAWSFADYFWFILKNVIGWVLIIASGPIGALIPGPGGIPLFLIGFGLITFPGKRRFTARVLRGIPVDRASRAYRIGLAIVAILLPAAVISYIAGKWWPFLDGQRTPRFLLVSLAYVCMVTLIWIFGLRGVHVINWIIAAFPKIRRRTRPWLRRRGLDLLPPRRRLRLRHGVHYPPDDEIIEIHHRHLDRLYRAWDMLRPWLMRLLRIAIVVAIFVWMLKPVYRNWHDPQVRERMAAINWWNFLFAALMFAAFLFVFRSMAWRRILIGLGHRLSIPAAARVWSFSEMARYIPGAIWQVVGRVYLTRPYGVSASISSASQLLELALFMLSNVLVALVCLVGAGVRRIPADQRHWLVVAAAFVPALLVLLHPRVFYGLLNRLLKRMKKPPVEQRLPKRMLAAIAVWTILGLLWQSLAVWLLTYSVLGLPLAKWYVLAGAYCLAWTIGFSVGFLSPGGMGVREAVFITTMQFLLSPAWVSQHLHFASREIFLVFLGFLGVLLRLWAIAGELIFASSSFIADRQRPR